MSDVRLQHRWHRDVERLTVDSGPLVGWAHDGLVSEVWIESQIEVARPAELLIGSAAGALPLTAVLIPKLHPGDL